MQLERIRSVGMRDVGRQIGGQLDNRNGVAWALLASVHTGGTRRFSYKNFLLVVAHIDDLNAGLATTTCISPQIVEGSRVWLDLLLIKDNDPFGVIFCSFLVGVGVHRVGALLSC